MTPYRAIGLAAPLTGERELDRLVDPLNAASKRVGEEGRRASAAERLAVVGRLVTGTAHEIRNPIAAMRLKAENAMAADNEDRRSAPQSILQQIGRLDGLLRDLLAMTQRRLLCARVQSAHTSDEPSGIGRVCQRAGKYRRSAALTIPFGSPTVGR
jgi:signal transduction histidine kinase